MSAPTSVYKSLPVESIEPLWDARFRPVSDIVVDSLAASIGGKRGLQSPLHVRKIRSPKNDRYVLMVGGHRLAAIQKLGWAEVFVFLWTDITDRFARSMEVDDNLNRNDLTDLDTGIFLVEAKRLFDEEHPELAGGKAGATARWDAKGNLPFASFVSSSAQNLGCSETKIKRLVKAVKSLEPAVIRTLQASPVPASLEGLRAIAELDAEHRGRVVEKFATGEFKKLSAAIKTTSTKKPTATKDPDKEIFDQLSVLWKRAPMAAKRRFVEATDDELRALLVGDAPEGQA